MAGLKDLEESPGALSETSVWSVARGVAALIRVAVSDRISGSRAELERLTATRMDASLLVFILCLRLIHVLQAAIDVTLGVSAYTHPVVAQLTAASCVVESLLLSVALVRHRRLTMPLLLADAVFGLVGLAVLSFATTATVHRTGTIDWMLPYTVGTATALGLLVTRDHSSRPDLPYREYDWREYDWRGAVAAALLALGYAASVSLPHLTHEDTVTSVIRNTGNYLLFYVAAAGVSIALGRQLTLIAAANEAANREASQLADEAHWRAVTVDVFGPVLDLLDRAADIGEDVPQAMRHEADRLIELIEATNPGITAGNRR